MLFSLDYRDSGSSVRAKSSSLAQPLVPHLSARPIHSLELRPAHSHFYSHFHARTLDSHVVRSSFIGVYESGAGEGNRTLVSGLGSPRSTIEPHPQRAAV